MGSRPEQTGKLAKPKPSRGDIWWVDLMPVRGHEQGHDLGKSRPSLVISVDRFNHGASGLIILVPITSKEKGIPFHVRITPPEGGLKHESFVMCEAVRSVSVDRLSRRSGRVSSPTLAGVEDRLKILLGL